jgi:hypothetical protein
MLAPSPTKTGGRGKPGSKQLRTSITPKRLAFGGVGSKGQVKKGASITPKRLAIKIEENAQVQDSGASEDAACSRPCTGACKTAMNLIWQQWNTRTMKPKRANMTRTWRNQAWQRRQEWRTRSYAPFLKTGGRIN